MRACATCAICAIATVAVYLTGSAAAGAWERPAGPFVGYGIPVNAVGYGPGLYGPYGYGPYAPLSPRMEPLIVYDFEPGIIVRSYWWAPWQNRHYFPRTGKRPKVGRLEHVTPRKVGHAESFHRFWSVSSVFAPELPPSSARPYDLEPPPSLAQPK
jgi:hypothetical protein